MTRLGMFEPQVEEPPGECADVVEELDGGVVEGRDTSSLPGNEEREVERALESQWGSFDSLRSLPMTNTSSP